MDKKILPIGTIVKLKNISKLVMVFGIYQKSGVENIKIVDYVGVPYPEGNIGPYAQIGFFADDIEEVVFEGYKCEAFEEWAQRAQKAYDEEIKDIQKQ